MAALGKPRIGRCVSRPSQADTRVSRQDLILGADPHSLHDLHVGGDADRSDCRTAHQASRSAVNDLQRPRAGDRVVVTDAAGGAHRYSVVSLDVVAKTAPLPSYVPSPDGPPQLVLVTCGGAYDRALHRYASDVLIRAVPVGS